MSARFGKFSLSEHVAFLAALRRVPTEPAHERWARVAVLMPGRVGGECRRYFHRVGRVGFIGVDGKVRRRLVCKARVVHGNTILRSRNALFLRRNLRKFVPGMLPELDDAMLRRPRRRDVPQNQIELLTYRPAKGVRSGNEQPCLQGEMDEVTGKGIRTGKIASEEMAMIRSKKRVPSRTKLNKVTKRDTHVPQKTNSLASSSVKKPDIGASLSAAACSIPPSARKPPLPKSASASRKRVVRDGTAAGKLGGVTVNRAGKKSHLTSPAAPSEGAVKNTFVGRAQKASSVPTHLASKPHGTAPHHPLALSSASQRPKSASGTICKPILLKLRIKKSEKHGPRVHGESGVTVNSRSGNSVCAITKQSGSRSSVSNFNNKSVVCTCALNGACHGDDAHAKGGPSDVQAGPGLAPDVPREDEAQEKYPANRKATQRISGAKETIGCVHKSSTQSYKTVPVSDNTEEWETKVPSSIWFPSRRLYGPSKASTPPADYPLPTQEDPHALSTASAMVNSPSAASRNGHEEVHSPTSPSAVSSKMDRAVPGTRKPIRPPMAPLEPFNDDETISLMDPNEGKMDAASEDSHLHTAPPTHDHDVPTLPGAVIVECKPQPIQEIVPDITAHESNKKRTSIDFLLCKEDHHQPLELSQKRQHVEKTGTVQLVEEEKYCCSYCRQRCERNTNVDLYEVAEGAASDAIFSWSLPRMGVTWTKAWTKHHWSALLREDDLCVAEFKFATMQQQAREMYELIKMFEGRTCATGVSLGHREERQRLLREFEARHGTLVESSSLIIRHVADSAKSSGRVPRPELRISRRERWGPEYHISENIEMGYEDMVTRLAQIWGAGMAVFLQRLNEMETRQEMEAHAVDSIRSVMTL